MKKQREGFQRAGGSLSGRVYRQRVPGISAHFRGVPGYNSVTHFRGRSCADAEDPQAASKLPSCVPPL